MPDDLTGLEWRFRRNLTLMNEHGVPTVDWNKKNPYRPHPDMREDQKRWLPTRDVLMAAHDQLKGTHLALVPISVFMLMLAFAEWALLLPKACACLTALFVTCLGVIMHKSYARAMDIKQYVQGMDALYQLPLRCDECSYRFFRPKVQRCGQCENCPRCEAPVNPPSRAEQCNDCKMCRMEGGPL